MDDSAQNTDRWPIFICYRQADGQATAKRIFSILNDAIVPVAGVGAAGEGPPPPKLDVYLDQAAPGVSDWTDVHEQFLKRARAMILICTPGAKLNEGPDDWVHKELLWWLQSRDMAPILVDPLGQELRYVPDAIAKRWPNAQRIRMREEDWEDLDDAGRAALDDRLREQFLGAIVPSADAFYRQELDAEEARARKLQSTRQTMVMLAALLVVVLGASGWIYWLMQQANAARDDAEFARLAEGAARLLAEARLIETQAVRAATEARLFNYLQQFPSFDAYVPQMQDWAGDFDDSAKDLAVAAQALLPMCDQVAGFTVYEGQMVNTGLALEDADGEISRDSPRLWAYLAVVPGSGTQDGDWAPAVLDLFKAQDPDLGGGRRLSRIDFKDRVRGAISPGDQTWTFVVGLAGGNYLSIDDATYRVDFDDVRMNDEGDMIMAFEICREASAQVDDPPD